MHEANSGRDAFPVFLRRGKLPKVSPECLHDHSALLVVLDTLDVGGVSCDADHH